MNPKQPSPFTKLLLLFPLVGYAAGVAVVTYVWLIMEDMRGSMHQAVLATGDPQKIASFEAALQYDRQVSMVVLGLTLLVSASFVAAGFIWLRKRAA